MNWIATFCSTQIQCSQRMGNSIHKEKLPLHLNYRWRKKLFYCFLVANVHNKTTAVYFNIIFSAHIVQFMTYKHPVYSGGFSNEIVRTGGCHNLCFTTIVIQPPLCEISHLWDSHLWNFIYCSSFAWTNDCSGCWPVIWWHFYEECVIY